MASLKVVCPKCGAFQGHVCGINEDEAKNYPDGQLKITCHGCRQKLKEKGEYLPFGEF